MTAYVVIILISSIENSVLERKPLVCSFPGLIEMSFLHANNNQDICDYMLIGSMLSMLLKIACTGKWNYHLRMKDVICLFLQRLRLIVFSIWWFYAPISKRQIWKYSCIKTWNENGCRSFFEHISGNSNITLWCECKPHGIYRYIPKMYSIIKKYIVNVTSKEG